MRRVGAGRQQGTHLCERGREPPGAGLFSVALRRTRVGAFAEARAISLEALSDLAYSDVAQLQMHPVETALDDIPALALTQEEAFRLTQGRPIVLLPRQVETLKPQVDPETRLVSAFREETLVALCEMRAGRLNPVRVFHLT